MFPNDDNQNSPPTAKKDPTKYSDYLLNNPESPPLTSRQPSESNLEPLAPAGVQMTPSSSLSPGFSLTSNVATLMDMGFPRERCIEALQKNLRY